MKIKAKEHYNAEKESTPKRKKKRHTQKFLFLLGRNYSHIYTEIRCFAAQLLRKARPREQRTQSDVKKEKGGKKSKIKKQRAEQKKLRDRGGRKYDRQRSEDRDLSQQVNLAHMLCKVCAKQIPSCVVRVCFAAAAAAAAAAATDAVGASRRRRCRCRGDASFGGAKRLIAEPRPSFTYAA